MDFTKIRGECRRLGIHYDAKSFNNCRPHNKNESLLHWSVKARLFHEFVKRGYSVFTEFPIRGGVCDLYCLDKNWLIEIETIPKIDKKYEIFGLIPSNKLTPELWVVPTDQFEQDFEAAVNHWLERFGLKEMGK